MVKMCPLLAVAIGAAGELRELGERGPRPVPPEEATWAQCAQDKCAWWLPEPQVCAIRALAIFADAEDALWAK